jgi:hypothetical protein
MRLLNFETHRLEVFDSNIPPYFILSHRWGEDEISYQDITTLSKSRLEQKRSWPKVLGFMNASQDPHPSCPKPKYGWVDTFCIDKTSSAELSEAINSMFRWYRNAALCIAFLDDVSTTTFDIEGDSQASDAFRNPKWFTRGWTLQELLAPSEVKFYNRRWEVIGLRKALASLISPATGIDIKVIETGKWSSTSVASRMKWAAKRVTTRLEDKAYCLLGIFDINMPLLYGEGDKAFRRLQEAILMEYDDHSIFLWSPPRGNTENGRSLPRSDRRKMAVAPALAADPSWFLDIPPHDLFPTDASPAILTNQGIQIKMPILRNLAGTHRSLADDLPFNAFLGIVSCCPMDDHTTHLAIPLERYSASTPVYNRLLAPPQPVSLGKASAKVDQIQLTRIPNSIAQPVRGLRSIQLVRLPRGKSRKKQVEDPSDKLHLKAVYPGYPPSSSQHTENSGAYRLEPSSPCVILLLEDEFSGPKEPLFLFMTFRGGVVPWRYQANIPQPQCLQDVVNGRSINLETPEQVSSFTRRFSEETKIPALHLRPQDILHAKDFTIGGKKYFANLTILSLREGYAGVVSINKYKFLSTLEHAYLKILGAWTPW